MDKKRQKICVAGMHCPSCEIVIAREFSKIPSVILHKVSHKNGFIDITCDEDDIPKIYGIIEKTGYKLSNDTGSVRRRFTVNDFIQVVLIFIIILSFGRIVSGFGVLRFFPDANGTIGSFTAFLLGLAASVSTCLALLGGVVISFGTVFGNIKLHLLFHLGRFGAFFVFGGVLGAAGSLFGFMDSVNFILIVFVSIVMLYMGLHLVGIVPSITRFGFYLPKFLSRKFHSAGTPLVIGILTFFLPCGFTQSAQLAAAVSGGFIGGALIMAAFAFGTFPVLLGIGLGSTYTNRLKSNLGSKFIGVFIVIFAIYSFNNALKLEGVYLLPVLQDTGSKAVIIKDGYQEVYMTVNYGFNPDEFTIKKDVPVKWIINGENISGCVSSIVVPELDLNFELKKGEQIIEFTPTETGDVYFSCSMGMVSGNFNVIE